MFQVEALQLFVMGAGQLFQMEARHLLKMEAGQLFDKDAGQMFEMEAGQLLMMGGRPLCRIKLLPVTHVLEDTWMLTVNLVYKLLYVCDDLKCALQSHM